MIEVYQELGKAISVANGIMWVDIAPRIAEHTNLYPAVYISINENTPINPIGGSTLNEFLFTVEIWIKPYNSSTIKPLSPALSSLGANIGIIDGVRRAIFNLENQYIRGTTMDSETLEKEEDGFYCVVQSWRAITAHDMELVCKLGKIPSPVFSK